MSDIIALQDLHLVGEDLHNADLAGLVLYKEKEDKEWYQLPDCQYPHAELEYVLKIKNLKKIEAYFG